LVTEWRLGVKGRKEERVGFEEIKKPSTGSKSQT
jgi:hypothetical protein